MKKTNSRRRRRVTWRGEENPAEEDRTFIPADSRYFQNGDDTASIRLEELKEIAQMFRRPGGMKRS
jgi:hypothetical protein